MLIPQYSARILKRKSYAKARGNVNQGKVFTFFLITSFYSNPVFSKGIGTVLPMTKEALLKAGHVQDNPFVSGHIFLNQSYSSHLNGYLFFNTSGNLPSRASGRQKLPLQTHDILRLSAFNFNIEPTENWNLNFGKPLANKLLKEWRVSPFWEASTYLKFSNYYAGFAAGISDFGNNTFEGDDLQSTWYPKVLVGYKSLKFSFELSYQRFNSSDNSISQSFWGHDYYAVTQPLWPLDTQYELLTLKANIINTYQTSTLRASSF